MAGQRFFASALDPGPDPEIKTARGLRVQVPKQGALPGKRGQIGEVYRGCGLADPALAVIDRNGIGRIAAAH